MTKAAPHQALRQQGCQSETIENGKRYEPIDPEKVLKEDP